MQSLLYNKQVFDARRSLKICQRRLLFELHGSYLVPILSHHRYRPVVLKRG